QSARSVCRRSPPPGHACHRDRRWHNTLVGTAALSVPAAVPQRDKEEAMPRPVTLFTGQWADLPLATLAEKVASWGFDGLELACWGDHFDVEQALSSDGYVRKQRELLEQHGLQCLAISTH